MTTLDITSVDHSRVEAVFDTDKGAMTIRFLPEKAPNTVRNFLELSHKGFYDGLTFHRIIKGFMVQAGCPRGDGTGGPGYMIDAEFNDTVHECGVLSMARSQDPDSAGSQFFIVHGDHASHLDGAYTAFGRVVEGLDVLDALASVQTRASGPNGEPSTPVEPIRIRSVKLRVAAEEQAASDGEAESETASTGESGADETAVDA